MWTSSGGMQDLGNLGGDGNSEALGINDNGQVVGYSFTPSNEHAFVWTQTGGMQDLGTLGGSISVATGINATGNVVGYSLGRTPENPAFAWSPPPALKTLPNLAGNPHYAHPINPPTP